MQFAYPTVKDKPVLQGLSFTVEPRQKVALVGAAGCGKSSVLRLLERFYRPEGGAIRVDGRPIEQYDVHHLRRHVAIVAQENVLFDRSIKENVTYGLEPPPSEEQVVQACKQANAWEFIEKFPEGLGFMVHTCVRGTRRGGTC